MSCSTRLVGLSCFLLLLLGSPGLAAGFEVNPDTASLVVQFEDETIVRPVMAVSVLPGEQALLRTSTPSASVRQAQSSPGTVFRISTNSWRFVAPKSPGLYPLLVTDSSREASIRLQVFVLRPWDPDRRSLAGYRVGHYQERARRGLETYEPPEGFMKVTAENRAVRLSPNFHLEQFLCKQTDEIPQFVLVRTRLLQRLEQVLHTVRERGHDAPTLHVMSGFRTPYYNRAIGNTTKYSRHLYGDAADIFIDADRDGEMDDLTGDDRAGREDANYLARVVRAVSTSGTDDQFEGGLGIYGPASHRGPFVHVDLRGYPARW